MTMTTAARKATMLVESRKLFMTRTVMDCASTNSQFARDVFAGLKKWVCGDWGELGDEDKEANSADIKSGWGHVLGKYDTCEGSIYINQELAGDRSQAVVVLFPEEW
ncbi:MAG: hypothetical protein SPL69_05535 [Succinivibrionaceae bacterium]|nr:hypothetical protein [Succinivibrionaceae bacterium]